MHVLAQALGSGLFETVSQLVVAAGTVILLLMLVALGAFAYKSLRGDGIRWPNEREDVDEDEVQQGANDDEWKYY